MIYMTAATILVSSFAIAGPPNEARRKDPVKVGDKAPTFTLKMLGSKKKFALSENFGKRPTVLIFGSYT